MTQAEINIWVRTQAKQARQTFAAVKRDLDKITAAGFRAGEVLDGLLGASKGYTASLGGTSAAAANLAKSLSLINKSGPAASKNVMNLGVAAELAAPAMKASATSAALLTASLGPLSTVAATAAAGVGALGKASGATVRAADRISSANKTIGSSAAATRNALTLTDRDLARINQTMSTTPVAGKSLGDKFGRLTSQFTEVSRASWGTEKSLDRINQSFAESTYGAKQYTNAWNEAYRTQARFNAEARKASPFGVAGRGAAPKLNTGAAAAATASLAGTAQNINWGPAAKALEQYRRDLAATTRAYGEMPPAAAQAEQATRSFRDRLAAAGQNAHAFNTKLYESSDALRKAGSQAQWTGRQLAVMFTAPTLLAGGLGMKWAMDYETAFIRLKKVYDGNMDELGGAGPEFKGSKFDKFFTAVSNRFGIAREEIAGVGADLAQAGMKGAQLAKATQLVAEFSIVGDQDLQKSTTDLISVMAQYKLSADEMRTAIEQLNAISNQTPVSMADLTDGFTRTASVAREAGVDVRHLGAFIAALVPAAGTAAVSANGLKSIFTRLMTPTKEAAGVLEQVGIQVGSVDWMSKNAVERLAELSTKFDGLSQQQKFDLAKPFAGLYQINKFVALMDDMAHAQGNYNKALEATETPAKAFETYQKELKMFLDSNPQKLKQAGTIIKNSLADAIIPLVPHIVWLAQSVAKAADAFSNLSPETQKFIILSALALAAVGPLAMLIGSFGILFGSAGKALSIFGKIASGTAFHLLGIGKATKVVGDEVVARTPFITRAWQGTMTALRGVTAVGAAAINGVWKLGMTVFSLVLRAGGALGLKNFSWYQALMLRVNKATQTKLVAQTVAGQRAQTAAIAAGGRAQAGAAAAGMAGTTKATKAGGRGWLGAVASVAMLFPELIWKGIQRIVPMLSQFWPKIVDGAKQILPKLGAVFARIAPNLSRSLLAAVPRIAAAGGAIAAGLTGPIGWAIAGIVTLIMLFPKQIWNAVKGLGRILATPFIIGFQLIGRVFGGAWDLVLEWARGVQRIVAGALMDDGIPIIAKPFVIAIQVAASALRALPGIVVAVFRGVVKVIQEAARAVYEAFSYINPFAHHSPSLVENVTNGMAIVRDEFAISASSIEASTKRAYRAISSMGQLTAGLRGRVEGMERDETLTKIGEADPAANRAYLMLEAQLPGLKSQLEAVNKAVERQEAVIDDLQKQVKVADRALDGLNDTLDELQERADSASKALDAAKEQLDYFANAPIRGMRAMSDAIFENEMAQKRLRLEIMKLEDAGESVDDLADRFSKLQGQIETLRGDREGLRLSGAGSDILSTYDKMIRDLEAQQGAAAQNRLSPIKEAQDELDRLAREAERLDLENALKFDPLTRQIDQMVNSTRELSFAEITSGIRTNQAAVAALTTEYDRANAAVAQQESVIKAAQQQRDALNDQIEREQDNLDILTKAQKDLEEAIKGVEDAMQQIVTWVDSLNRMLEENEEKAKKAKDAAEDLAAAWEEAGLGDFEVPGGKLDEIFDDADIDKMTEELTNQVAQMFDGIDVGSAISGFFGNIGNWFKELPGRIWGWLSGIPGSIARQIGEWAGQVGGWFAGVGSSIGGWFGGLWTNHIWPALTTLPGQISTFLINLPSELVSAGSYIVGYISGIFYDAGREAVNWITGIGGKIGAYFTEGGFREDVTNVTNAVHDWFYEQIDEITRVATETIPNAGRAIGRYFTEGGFREDVTNVTSAVHNWFYEQVDEITRVATETIPNAGRAIADYFTRDQDGFRSDVAGVWNAMLDIGGNIISGIWNGITTAFSNARQWIEDNVVNPLVNGFKDALGIHSPSTVFKEIGGFLIDGMWEGIKGAGGWFLGKITGWVEEHIPGPIRRIMEIGSPSKLMARYGGWIAEGLANGIDAGGSQVDAASTALAEAAVVGTAPLNAAETAYSGTFTAIGTQANATMSAAYTQLSATQAAWSSATATQLTATAAVSAAQFDGMSAAAQKSMNDMSSGVSSTAGALSKSLTDTFAASTSAVISSSATMTDTVTGNFQSLATNLASIFNEQIVPVLSGFNPALGAVQSWFGETVANVGTTWAGIKEPVAVPARFIVNDVYNDGIRGAWNKFNGFLDLPALDEHIARFAAGGPIRGAGTGTSDSILARVANGEHVVTAAEVRGAGGHAAIEAARAAWKQGLPAFAAGGPVDLNAAPWGGGGGESNLKPAAILARRNIHKYWPQITTIGGYRASDPYPDHPSGLALDIMTGDPIGTEVNEWLHREKDALALNYTIWRQFYKPAGGIGNLMEDRGSPTQNHMDHVHALFNANGVAGIQDGGVGSFTVPMDQVVRDAINAQMDAVAKRAPQLAGGIGRWPLSSVEKARNQLLDFMVPKAAAMSKASSGAGTIGNAESWRAMAIEAMKRNGFAWQNKEQVDAMLRQIMTESTGNPAAFQQVIDVNSGGNEAAGLLQITPRTWAAYRDPTLPDNRLDPWASMNAALRYYKARYGMDLTTNWGRGIGYDSGGWLMPGENQRVYNATGKPEAVLENSDWKAIYAAANNPVTAAMISAGVVDAIESVYGYAPTREAAVRAAAAYQDANAAWTPVLYDAAKSQVAAAEGAAQAATKTASGVEQFVAVGKAINDAVVEFGDIAKNAFTAYEAYGKGELTFEMVAPVLSGIANLVGMIPDQKAEYVPWAGTAQKVTPEMKRQKAANDAVNIGKGLLQFAKDTIPSILTNTAAIGTAIEKLMVQNGPVIAAAIAMFPANPIGAAITLIPVILQGISTILPAIIQAVTEIVPNLINAIMRFITQFLPNSTYAYDSYEAAAKAAQENQAAIRNGASAPYFKEPTTVQQSTTNETVTINVYGVNMPNVTNGSDAGAFITNLQVLASNG